MKTKSIGVALIFFVVMSLGTYVVFNSCKRDPIDNPPDDGKIISKIFDIVPQDFVADTGGVDIYLDNLALWQSGGINGSAHYATPDSFDFGLLTLQLQVRRDKPEVGGGLRVNSKFWKWAIDFSGHENATPFYSTSDTLNFSGVEKFDVGYIGDAGANVDVISGKLVFFKKVD